MLFQGQEMLEDEWFRDTDPLDWSKAKDFAGVLRMYRDLIRLRLNKNNTTKGLTGSGFAICYEHQDDRVIAFHRWYNGGSGDDVLVLMNLSTERKSAVPIPVPQIGKWKLQFNSDWKGYSEEFGDFSSEPFVQCQAIGELLQFDIAPYSVQVLILT